MTFSIHSPQNWLQVIILYGITSLNAQKFSRWRLTMFYCVFFFRGQRREGRTVIAFIVLRRDITLYCNDGMYYPVLWSLYGWVAEYSVNISFSDGACVYILLVRTCCSPNKSTHQVQNKHDYCYLSWSSWKKTMDGMECIIYPKIVCDTIAVKRGYLFWTRGMIYLGTVKQSWLGNIYLSITSPSVLPSRSLLQLDS